MRHVTHINESCHLHPPTPIGHNARTNESGYAYEFLKSRVCMRHVTYEPVTYEPLGLHPPTVLSHDARTNKS